MVYPIYCVLPLPLPMEVVPSVRESFPGLRLQSKIPVKVSLSLPFIFLSKYEVKRQDYQQANQIVESVIQACSNIIQSTFLRDVNEEKKLSVGSSGCRCLENIYNSSVTPALARQQQFPNPHMNFWEGISTVSLLSLHFQIPFLGHK